MGLLLLHRRNSTDEESSYLLDTYPASSAYSVRKLTAASTLSMRIKRESDNAELDIGFTGDNLDVTAITNHCSASNGYVVKWYDQVGNHDLDGGVGAEPQIYFSATGIQYDGTRPALNFSAIRTMSTATFPLSTPISVFGVGKNPNGDDYRHFLCGKSAQRIYVGNVPGGHYATFFGSGTWHDAAGNTPNVNISAARTRMGVVNNGTNATPYLNGTAQNNKVGTMDATAGFDVGHSGNTYFWAGNISELIVFLSNQNANALAIQADQLAYFG